MRVRQKKRQVDKACAGWGLGKRCADRKRKGGSPTSKREWQSTPDNNDR